MPKQAVCAEIGVWQGDFSDLILQKTKPSKLFLIDPWQYQDDFPERMYGGKIAKDQKDMDEIYYSVKNRFAKLENIIFIRKKSLEALAEIPNSTLDWIYIDGNHSYDFVFEDLKTSFLKVKKNGFIIGDDFFWGKNNNYPVKKAVVNFTSKKGLSYSCIGNQFLIHL